VIGRDRLFIDNLFHERFETLPLQFRKPAFPRQPILPPGAFHAFHRTMDPEGLAGIQPEKPMPFPDQHKPGLQMAERFGGHRSVISENRPELFPRLLHGVFRVLGHGKNDLRDFLTVLGSQGGGIVESGMASEPWKN